MLVRLQKMLAALILTAPLICSVWAQDIVISQVASQTHPLTANNAIGMAQGFNAYFANINASGGVNGHKVVLENKDDRFEPAEAVKQIGQVADENKAVALFGLIGTASLSEIVKKRVLIDSGLALVAPLNGVPALIGSPNVFPVRASYFDEIDEIVGHLSSTYHKRVAFVYLVSPISESLKTKLAEGLKKRSIAMTSGIGIDSVPDKEKMTIAVESAVDKVLATNPDAIVVFGPGNIGSNLVRYVHAKKGQITAVYLMSIIGYDELIKAVGLSAATGVIISQALPMPTDSRLKIVKQYLSDLSKYAPDAKPSYPSLEGYIGARVMHEALKKAGPNPTRATLLKSLESMGRFDAGDFQVNYSAVGKSGSKIVDITLINKTGYLIH